MAKTKMVLESYLLNQMTGLSSIQMLCRNAVQKYFILASGEIVSNIHAGMCIKTASKLKYDLLFHYVRRKVHDHF